MSPGKALLVYGNGRTEAVGLHIFPDEDTLEEGSLAELVLLRPPKPGWKLSFEVSSITLRRYGSLDMRTIVPATQLSRVDYIGGVPRVILLEAAVYYCPPVEVDASGRPMRPSVLMAGYHRLASLRAEEFPLLIDGAMFEFHRTEMSTVEEDTVVTGLLSQQGRTEGKLRVWLSPPLKRPVKVSFLSFL